MSGDVSIDITPTDPLFDEEVRMAFSGLAPEREVDVAAEMSLDGRRWRATATFEADADGSVDLTESAPVAGCYDGVRPMGLFQFMHPVGTADDRDSWVATVDVTVEGPGTEAQRTVERRIKAPDVAVSSVEHDDVVGTFFDPDVEQPASPVLVLGGSESSDPETLFAPLLASRGHPTLELSYYGVDGLPSDLAEIPVEYFQTAGAWLLDQSSVDDDAIDVLGKGRGADLALFLGAHASEIETVVAYNGSGILLQGIPDGLHEPGPMVTLGGEALPCVRSDFGLRFLLEAFRCWVTGDPVELRPIYERGLENARNEDVREATIPIEGATGPVVQITGEDDRTRNVTELASVVEERLDSETGRDAHEHRRYDAAGYDVRAPYYPVTDRRTGQTVFPELTLDFGGSPDGYAEADVDAWAVVTEYLARDSASTPESDPKTK